MSQKKTTNLVPNKFRTPPNTKFINSVIEPLISEPELRRVNGYVGQKITRSYRVGDGYIQESNETRQHRQLDPTLIVNDITTQKIKLTVGYTELLDRLRYLGNTVDNANLLFEQTAYNYYPHFNVDKFVNYAQYYWASVKMPAAKIIDSNIIYIDTDILNQTNYTSANGVVFTNGLLIIFKTATEPTYYQNQTYYVEQVGNGIRLVNINNLVSFDSYLDNIAIPYDDTNLGFGEGPYDIGFNYPILPEYFVINKSDKSCSAWARCNRWVHIDVIHAIEQYENITIDLSNFQRATRPIIEFDPDIALFNHGTSFYGIVDLIDNTTLDPLSDIDYIGFQNSLISQLLDSREIKDGFKLVFTAASDPLVKNKIFSVRVDQFGSPKQNRINLTATSDVLVENSGLLVSNGQYRGQMFVYKNGNWQAAQQKTQVNQPPLFDLFDLNGNSYADSDYYPNSTFGGNKLFSYKLGTGVRDAALGLPLSYRSIGNVGDILFEDCITNGLFRYLGIPSGYAVSTALGRIQIQDQLADNWVRLAKNSAQRQIFEFTVNNANSYVIDIMPVDDINSIDVNVNGQFLNQNEFVYDTATLSISFVNKLNPDDFISILVYSDQVSKTAYYELPANLINNSDNQDISTVTLGQMRNHITSQFMKSLNLSTTSIRDFPIADQTMGTILKHSAPLTPAMFFLCNNDFDFVASLDRARTAYSFFKKRFLDAASTLAKLDFDNIPSSVDTILDYINQNNSPDMPYYYSDMVAHGSKLSQITYSITNLAQQNYGIQSIFDNTVPSGRSVLVYYKNSPWRQLICGQDYIFNKNSPSIKLLKQLDYGGILEIRDYESTDGAYIPETPTKMGLWPAAVPEIRVDNSFQNPQTVIVGHDGSRTIGFGDVRDHMLLELELRIFNNIKQHFAPNKLDPYEVIAGVFRTNGYTIDQVNQIIAPFYHRWKTENNLESTAVNFFKNSDPWTWNYYNQLAKNNSRLTGSWAAVFRYWYDTTEPDTRPWEMLGYTIKPRWWETKYGPAPYTADNGILWNDIRLGVQTDETGLVTTVNPLFARGGIANYMPVDRQGKIRTPLEIFVKVFNGAITNSVYAFGMGDPIENSWRRSSEFPFAMQIAMAVLKPARYFAQFASTTTVDNDALVQAMITTTTTTRAPTTTTTTTRGPTTTTTRAPTITTTQAPPTASFLVSPATGNWTLFGHPALITTTTTTTTTRAPTSTTTTTAAPAVTTTTTAAPAVTTTTTAAPVVTTTTTAAPVVTTTTTTTTAAPTSTTTTTTTAAPIITTTTTAAPSGGPLATTGFGGNYIYIKSTPGVASLTLRLDDDGGWRIVQASTGSFPAVSGSLTQWSPQITGNWYSPTTPGIGSGYLYRVTVDGISTNGGGTVTPNVTGPGSWTSFTGAAAGSVAITSAAADEAVGDFTIEIAVNNSGSPGTIVSTTTFTYNGSRGV